jgi:hypothetical protein
MRESEREASGEFVAASSARLFRVAMALTGGHHAAEDLLQGALDGRPEVAAPDRGLTPTPARLRQPLPA